MRGDISDPLDKQVREIKKYMNKLKPQEKWALVEKLSYCCCCFGQQFPKNITSHFHFRPVAYRVA
jgi:hypothetical protein